MWGLLEKHIAGLKHILKEESTSAMFCFKSQKSFVNRIDCGIPQGSCLGALLLITYISDFERCLQDVTPIMYADDTSKTCSSTYSASLQRNINIEMANVAEWMSKNRLSLYVNDSEVKVIRHSRHHNSLNELKKIEVNQENIGRVTKTKYLGLSIDENLSWKD